MQTTGLLILMALGLVALSAVGEAPKQQGQRPKEDRQSKKARPLQPGP